MLDVMGFADNTGILITANFQVEHLQKFNHVWNHMSKLFQANCLILNPTKTQVLKFTSVKLLNLYQTSSLACNEISDYLEESHSIFAQEVEFCPHPHEAVIL